MSESSKYQSTVDLSDKQNSHTLMVEMVGSNKRVLEVGCSTGYVSKVLRDRSCRVTGIEIDAEAAIQAKEFCEEVIVGDVESLDLGQLETSGSFEAILIGDVLEHLRDPLSTLRRLKRLLFPSGIFVASVPNIAHGSIRLSLLQGRFDYNPLGLLDETHLKFFTRDSLERMFRDAGLAVVETRRTKAPIFGSEIHVDRELVGAETLAQIESDPESLTYQFVVKAVFDDADQAIRDLHLREENLKLRVKELEETLPKIRAELQDSQLELNEAREMLGDLQHQNLELLERVTEGEEHWRRFESRRTVKLYRGLQRLLGTRRGSPERPG